METNKSFKTSIQLFHFDEVLGEAQKNVLMSERALKTKFSIFEARLDSIDAMYLQKSSF